MTGTPATITTSAAGAARVVAGVRVPLLDLRVPESPLAGLAQRLQESTPARRTRRVAQAVARPWWGASISALVDALASELRRRPVTTGPDELEPRLEAWLAAAAASQPPAPAPSVPRPGPVSNSLVSVLAIAPCAPPLPSMFSAHAA